MESLGSIYKRIAKRQTGYNGSPTAVAEPLEAVCPKCKGTGWVSYKVPRHDPNFGEAFACECQVPGQRVGLLRVAGLPGQADRRTRTIDSFERLDGCGEALDAITAMAGGNCDWNILTLQGPNGTGKTHLLEALGRTAIQRGVVVRYLFAPAWVESLRAAQAPGASPTMEELWHRVNSAELILLDDITDNRVTPFAIEQVGRLIDDRYRDGGLLAVGTNLELQKMAQIWDRRIADRLFEEEANTKVARLTGVSYRTGEDWGSQRRN